MKGGRVAIVKEHIRNKYLYLHEMISAMEEGSKVTVKPHRLLDGVFIAKGEEVKDYVLCTKNMVPGEAVYNEKIISAENEDGTNVEYRVWSPFCSSLAAAILLGVEDIYIKPGARVLYLGAGSGTSVSHVSDIVGPDGLVYAVESSLTSGGDLANMAEKRPNVIPIFQDAKFPEKYSTLVGTVDVICADIADPDRARIVALNALYCLKDGGHFMMSIKASWEQVELEKRLGELQASRLILVDDLHLWIVLEESDCCTFGYYDRTQNGSFPNIASSSLYTFCCRSAN